jgi:hypothetical protein
VATDELFVKLPGNSQAHIEICSVNGQQFIKKTCTGLAAIRLLKQIKKQREFTPTDRVASPRIDKITIAGDVVSVFMEYIVGLDFVTYTSCCEVDDFNQSIDSLVSIVIDEFRSSTIMPFPREIWLKKVDSACSCESIDSEIVRECRTILTTDLPNEIPIGPCHGDLTFSNVIVSANNTLFVFDFLDPPIETPYEDVAKILQDADFFWSLQKFNGKCDVSRVKIFWEHAANMLRQKMHEILVPELLRKFQILGLLRIVPYTNERKIVEFVTSSLRKLII